MASDCEEAATHPSSVVRKKLPGRKLSFDYRIVPDLRQAYLVCDKEDLYPVGVINIVGIAERILKLQRGFPTFPLLVATRGIDGAVRRVMVRPDLIKIPTTDIPGDPLGRVGGLF